MKPFLRGNSVHPCRWSAVVRKYDKIHWWLFISYCQEFSLFKYIWTGKKESIPDNCDFKPLVKKNLLQWKQQWDITTQKMLKAPEKQINTLSLNPLKPINVTRLFIRCHLIQSTFGDLVAMRSSLWLTKYFPGQKGVFTCSVQLESQFVVSQAVGCNDFCHNGNPFWKQKGRDSWMVTRAPSKPGAFRVFANEIWSFWFFFF